MRLLLDTCAFLWALQQPRRLSLPAREALQNPENEILVSTVSFWEISLKSALGKLPLSGGGPADMPGYALAAGFEILPLDPDTAATVADLRPLPDHRDPFDRMLVWTALQGGLHLVSRDRRMSGYLGDGLKICW